MYAFSVDTSNPQYKGPFNSILNISRVFTPDDTAFVTPNSDTPYSFAGLDLRAEPVVITLPAMEENRYFVFQLMDLYTFNFDYIGTREYLKNDYVARAAGTQVGIGANSREEALYPMYEKDSKGQPLNGASHRYILRFAKDQLPPVNAFWSLTMYNLPSQLLVKNPLNRYLINSPMLPGLKNDPDGGLTLYIQNQSPGPDKEANWLPAPKGPFMATMRYYWPKQTLLDGQWKSPKIERVKQENSTLRQGEKARENLIG